jgi:DNA-binding transcriptional ArsR family regulator
MKATDQLSVVFAALADPTRRTILARLADGKATVTELTEPFAISMPAISRHLKVLEQAGLISRSRSGQWRSSTLEAAPLKEVADWMDRYRLYWDANFDRLDAHLRQVTRGDSAAGSGDTATEGEQQ